MRIISGKYGGRTLAVPKSTATRPMTDKVRGALFDILGPIDGMTVLDAYAGSGAIGFEALSRGALRVVAIEIGHQALRAISSNIESLGLGFEYSVEPIKVESWLAHKPAGALDLIFAMPPYAAMDKEILARLAALLAEDGVMVVEYPRQAKDYTVDGLSVIDSRSYGDPTLVFYKKQ